MMSALLRKVRGVRRSLILTSMQDVLLFMTCPLGAAFAASSVAIARKAELHDSEKQRLLNLEPRWRSVVSGFEETDEPQ
jgi:hypothetical protein